MSRPWERNNGARVQLTSETLQRITGSELRSRSSTPRPETSLESRPSSTSLRDSRDYSLTSLASPFQYSGTYGGSTRFGSLSQYPHRYAPYDDSTTSYAYPRHNEPSTSSVTLGAPPQWQPQRPIPRSSSWRSTTPPSDSLDPPTSAHAYPYYPSKSSRVAITPPRRRSPSPPPRPYRPDFLSYRSGRPLSRPLPARTRTPPAQIYRPYGYYTEPTYGGGGSAGRSGSGGLGYGYGYGGDVGGAAEDEGYGGDDEGYRSRRGTGSSGGYTDAGF